MDALTQVQQYATTGALEVWAIVGNFLALIILSLLLFLFAYRVGKGAFISLIMAIYVGYALFLVFPYTDVILKGIGNAPTYVAAGSLVLYIIATAAPYFIIRKVAASDFIYIGTLSLVALAVLVAALLLAIANHALSVSSLYAYPQPLAALFAPAKYFFWWFIAPLAGLLLLAR